MTKRCSTCGEIKDKSEFNNNKDNVKDGLAKICRECASMYYRQHRERMIEKHGLNGYRYILWEKRLRSMAKKAGLPLDADIDFEKIKNIRINLIDYPDQALPYSMNHLDFMDKYDLNVNEYLFLRKTVMNNKFVLMDRKV
jgi:hypothetical protein